MDIFLLDSAGLDSATLVHFNLLLVVGYLIMAFFL